MNPVSDTKRACYMEINAYLNVPYHPNKEYKTEDFKHHLVTYNTNNERLGCIVLTPQQAFDMALNTGIIINDATDYYEEMQSYLGRTSAVSDI